MILRSFAAYVLAGLAYVAAQSPAPAAEIRVERAGDLSLIFVVGQLEPGDHTRFIQLALPLQRAVVLLGSEGGNLTAGIEIGKAIRLKDFTTYVPDDILCASACALAWLGGTRRLMAATARIGFHAAFRMQNGSAMESGLGNALVGAYVNSLGLSQRAVEFISSANPASMQWLTLANAAQYGIEVGRFDLEKNEPPRRPGGSAAPSASANPGGSIPQFRDYPATYMHAGANAQVDLSGPAWTFRTRLRNASRLRPNFGGRFIVVTWGCGASCLTGAVIDAPTGKVTFLPFSICCARPVDPKFNAIEFRRNSRLIVFAGMRNEEEPMGAHFYEFDGSSFRFIRTIADDGAFAPRQ